VYTVFDDQILDTDMTSKHYCHKDYDIQSSPQPHKFRHTTTLTSLPKVIWETEPRLSAKSPRGGFITTVANLFLTPGGYRTAI